MKDRDKILQEIRYKKGFRTALLSDMNSDINRRVTDLEAVIERCEREIALLQDRRARGPELLEQVDRELRSLRSQLEHADEVTKLKRLLKQLNKLGRDRDVRRNIG